MPYTPAMSLNQKYTWADFLRKHPEAKAKKLKRTSKEGKKAFEEAFKTYAKAYLKDLTARLERTVKRATTRRDHLVGRLKATQKAPRAKILQIKVGQKDHAIHFVTRQIQHVKAAQKSL